MAVVSNKDQANSKAVHKDLAAKLVKIALKVRANQQVKALMGATPEKAPPAAMPQMVAPMVMKVQTGAKAQAHPVRRSAR